MRTVVLYSIAILAVALPIIASAQSFLSSNPNTLLMEISPQYPRSEEPVTATLTSSHFDVSSATISWYVNGALVKTGVGESAFTTKTGGVGSNTKLRAVAQSGTFVDEASATIRPAQIDILWEARSFTPPFFRGRALPTTGTTIAARAVPQVFDEKGGQIADADLIFTWKINNRTIANISGRGKASATFTGPLRYGSQTITVEVTDTKGTTLGKTALILAAQEPHLVFYEDYPLIGIAYHQALKDGAKVPDTETNIVAVPYYINPVGLSYQWSLDGTPITSDAAQPGAISVRTTSSEQQEGRLGVLVESAIDILQRVQASVMIALNSPVDFTQNIAAPVNTNDPFGLPTQ